MLRAIRFQIAKDTSPERTKFIAEYFTERPVLKLLVAMFHRSPFFGLEAIALVLLGMSRCVPLNSRSTGKALWWTRNEERYLKSYLDGLSVEYIRYHSSFGNFFRAWRYLSIRNLRRIFRVARKLVRRHSIVVAIRAVETIIFYQYVKTVVEREQTFRFYSSTQSHPYFSALNELSRNGRLSLCFLAHSPWVLEALPIYCDLGVFWGPAGANQFVHCGSQLKEVAFYYPERKTTPQSTLSQKIVLISLSKNPDWQALRKIIDELGRSFPQYRLVVRGHPNSLFAIPDDILSLVSPGRLGDQLLSSAFMIAGNSTVHLEALLYGVPTFWAPELDGEQSSPLEFFQMIPIQRIQRLWEMNSKDLTKVYSAEIYSKVRTDFFADTSLNALKTVLIQFQNSPGRYLVY